MEPEKDVAHFVKQDRKESKGLVKSFLEERGILGLDKRAAFLRTVQLVSAIPWGEARMIEEVLVSKQVGTCVGKHMVLKTAFDILDIPCTETVCTFQWIDQPIQYPSDVNKILAEGAWDHGHNFLVVDGVDVDITWNPELKPFGFTTLPEEWDGKTSVLGVKIKERWDDVEDMKAKKLKLVESLSDEQRKRRARFLEAFIAWIDSINHPISTSRE
ncbi:MAG: hypothetical protein ABIC95_02440 [archaeon]